MRKRIWSAAVSICVIASLSGCFVADAVKRRQAAKRADPNLPAMRMPAVNTNAVAIPRLY